MRLYIAEKPSLGRAIASALPKPHTKQEGFIKVGNGDCVSWCIGHLLEQAPPEAYDPAYKKWRLEHLPIKPENWQLEAKPKTKKQLQVLRKLIKEADSLVHAGDPDREGQLLVDEVINYLKVPAAKKENMQRCLISDLNTSAVQRALSKLRSNKEFLPLSVSALARSRADWLYGMNMTRLCSIKGQQAGYKGVLSVGRVQTPLLGLVVRRDEEIEHFVPKPYYDVYALLETEKGEQFKAKWQPSEACSPYQDEEGRVLSKALAENVVARISGKDATVKTVSKKQKSQAAPLPYNLSALQIDAAKRYGLQAKQVLDICQSLYEKYKLITYPRSDCRYLPNDHYSQAKVVSAAIASSSSNLSQAVADADLSLRSKAWNDKNVGAHHAIIPTAKKADASKLPANEQKIYELIARQYIAQFYPAWRYEDCQANIEIEGGAFLAKSRHTIDMGWKTLFKGEKSSNKQTEGEEEFQAKLPALKKGQALKCLSGECLDKVTKPPKHFTDATLLSAMTGIARFVKDSEIKKILKDTDGLGTEATRAGIIELLFKRKFLVRQGKQIRSTIAGRKLIAALPDSATTPDMTAHWESQLESMSKKEVSYKNFMGSLETTLPCLINTVESSAFRGLENEGAPSTFKRRRKSKQATNPRKKTRKSVN